MRSCVASLDKVAAMPVSLFLQENSAPLIIWTTPNEPLLLATKTTQGTTILWGGFEAYLRAGYGVRYLWPIAP